MVPTVPGTGDDHRCRPAEADLTVKCASFDSRTNMRLSDRLSMVRGLIK